MFSFCKVGWFVFVVPSLSGTHRIPMYLVSPYSLVLGWVSATRAAPGGPAKLVYVLLVFASMWSYTSVGVCFDVFFVWSSPRLAAHWARRANVTQLICGIVFCFFVL